MTDIEKRIAELESEVDQAVENRDYWKGQAIVLKAKEKEFIRESRDYWNRVLVSLGINNYDCATYLAEYNKTMEK